jgi:hypothetical protein
MKKELRGIKAVHYTEEQGIFIDVDEDFLVRAEGERLGRRATEEDIDNLFMERLGRGYDPTDLLPGEDSFNLLLEVYGDQWIYVALEGSNPAQEERAVLRMYRQLLKERNPSCGGDLLDIAARYGPRLRSTGFPKQADTNLLFHAALRLVEQGELKAVMDRDPFPEDASPSYGKRRFFIPPDWRVSLSGALCGACHEELQSSSPHLHQECRARLRTVLGKVRRRTSRKGRA